MVESHCDTAAVRTIVATYVPGRPLSEAAQRLDPARLAGAYVAAGDMGALVSK